MFEGLVFGLKFVNLLLKGLELGLALDAEAEGALAVLKQPTSMFGKNCLTPAGGKIDTTYLLSFLLVLDWVLFLRPRLAFSTGAAISSLWTLEMVSMSVVIILCTVSLWEALTLSSESSWVDSACGPGIRFFIKFKTKLIENF